jgi:hypothetical protein
MRNRASIEARAQLGKLPGQAIEHRLSCGRCGGQRRVLAGFRAPPVCG